MENYTTAIRGRRTNRHHRSNKKFRIKALKTNKSKRPIIRTAHPMIMRKSSWRQREGLVDKSDYIPIKKASLSGRARELMESCAEWADLLPNKEDSKFKAALKLITLFERIRLTLEEDKDPYNEYYKEKGLIRKFDKTFIGIFVNTPVKSIFKENKIELSDDLTRRSCKLHEFVHPEFGKIYLHPNLLEKGNNDYIREEHEAFYHSKDFNFEKVLNELWSFYDNRININGSQDKLKYTTIPKPTDPFTGGASKWVDELSEQHSLYKKDGVARAVLFVGPPGVGKTTLVQKVSENIGSRILRMEAAAVGSLSPESLQFLIGGLKPHVMIVDDIDRQVGRYDTTMFTVLDWMKVKYPSVPFFMTANRVSNLDQAFMRPGRIDEVKWFRIPDEKDRLILLDTYLDHYNVSISEEEKKEIVDNTDGLAVPWIKEISLQLRYQDFKSVIKLIQSMKKLKDSLSFNYGEGDEKYDLDTIDV